MRLFSILSKKIDLELHVISRRHWEVKSFRTFDRLFRFTRVYIVKCGKRTPSYRFRSQVKGVRHRELQFAKIK